MTVRVVFTKRAASQIDAADRWWQEHRAAAPDAIRDDLAAAIELLAEQPGLGTPVQGSRHPGDRRILLRRVSYHVYYRVRDDAVEVLRFWHASRGAKPRI